MDLKEKMTKKLQKLHKEGKPPLCNICGTEIRKDDDFEYVETRRKKMWIHRRCVKKVV